MHIIPSINDDSRMQSVPKLESIISYRLLQARIVFINETGEWISEYLGGLFRSIGDYLSEDNFRDL